MMQFYNEPKYQPPERYQSVIARAIDLIQREKGVLSIYQLGSAGTPGISDIDLLVVFEEGTSSSFNLFDHLSREDRYFFVHEPFGIPRHLFDKAQRYTLYHNYNLLWGMSSGTGPVALDEHEIHALKNQIALEFLVSNYISKSLEKTYETLNVRSTLLAVNALRYDLDFLEVTSGRFYDLVYQLVEWRKRWFEKRVSNKQFVTWLNTFYDELPRFIDNLNERNRLYLPVWANHRYARHVRLEPGDDLGYSYEGYILPSMLRYIGRKYNRLQSRLISFRFSIPVTSKAQADILEKRFLFLKESVAYNVAHLNAFSALSGNLGISSVK